MDRVFYQKGFVMVSLLSLMLCFGACGRFKKSSSKSSYEPPTSNYYPEPSSPEDETTTPSSQPTAGGTSGGSTVSGGSSGSPTGGSPSGSTTVLRSIIDEGIFSINGKSQTFASTSPHDCHAQKTNGSTVAFHSVFRLSALPDSPGMVVKLSALPLTPGPQKLSIENGSILFLTQDRTLRRSYKANKATSCISDTTSSAKRINITLTCSQMSNPFDGSSSHQATVKLSCPIL